MAVELILDLDALRERTGGDAELLADIVHIFLNSYPPVMAKIQQAIVSSDYRGLERAAHNLRGYLVDIHASRASETARELEIKGRTRDCKDAETLFSKLEREMVLLPPMLTTLNVHRGPGAATS